jgi:hypothetical protein
MFKFAMTVVVFSFSLSVFAQGVIFGPEQTDLERKSSNVDNLINSNNEVSKCLDGGEKVETVLSIQYDRNVKEGIYLGKTSWGDFLKVTAHGNKELQISLRHCPPRYSAWENGKQVLKEYPVNQVQIRSLNMGERNCDFQNIIASSVVIRYGGVYIPRELEFRIVDSAPKEKEAYGFFCPLEGIKEKVAPGLPGQAGDSVSRQ